MPPAKVEFSQGVQEGQPMHQAEEARDAELMARKNRLRAGRANTGTDSAISASIRVAGTYTIRRVLSNAVVILTMLSSERRVSPNAPQRRAATRKGTGSNKVNRNKGS